MGCLIGAIELRYDPDRRNFSVSALIVPPPGTRRPGSAPFVLVEMIVDTGSNITMVNPRTAELLGIELDSLPTMRTAGIGGFVATPCIDGLEMFLSGGDVGRIRLEEVAIFEELRERVAREDGRKVPKGKPSHPGYNLFGLDALPALHGALEIDMARQPGVIHW